jgi:hypothetical protein
VTAADFPARAQTGLPISDESALQMVSETVDEREPHPSRRSQRTGPPQGERILSFENNRTARPEEAPSSGGVSKGARWRKSTVSPQGVSGAPRPGSAWHEVRGRASPTLRSLGSGSWAPSGRAPADLKSSLEDGVVPRSTSFETAPETTAPPQDERGVIGARQLAAHPEEAAPEQARSFRAVSKGSQRPSRRVPAEPNQSSIRPVIPVRK